MQVRAAMSPAAFGKRLLKRLAERAISRRLLRLLDSRCLKSLFPLSERRNDLGGLS